MVYVTTRQFVQFNLFKIVHGKYDKLRRWESCTAGVRLKESITDNITIKFYLRFKL